MSFCSVIPSPKLPTPARWRLFADHEVEAEVLGAGAAVALGHGHPEEAAAAGQREDLARHDPRALPLAVAALLADHLPLEERAKARAEVFVHILEQRASHAARSILPGLRRGRRPSRKLWSAEASNRRREE